MGEGWDKRSAQRRRDRANCCAHDRRNGKFSCLMVLHQLWPSVSAIADSSSARPSEDYQSWKYTLYKDILSCCRQNGRINRAVHAYTGSLHQAVASFLLRLGGRAPVRPPSKYAPVVPPLLKERRCITIVTSKIICSQMPEKSRKFFWWILGYLLRNDANDFSIV